MATAISVTVQLEAHDTIQNPERVGKQAAEMIAKLMYETYELGAKDKDNPLVKLQSVAYTTAEAAELPGRVKK